MNKSVKPDLFTLAGFSSYNKYPPAVAGGISVSGIALILLAAHKRAFRLACQPCNHYLLLVNEFQPKPSSERKVAFAEYFTRQMTKGACVHIDFFVFWDRVSYSKT